MIENIKSDFVDDGEFNKRRIEDWNNDTTNMDSVVQWYGYFLDYGDFERYQPLVYKHTREQWVTAQRNLVKALWIRARFPLYGSTERSFYGSLQKTELNKLMDMAEYDENHDRLVRLGAIP